MMSVVIAVLLQAAAPPAPTAPVAEAEWVSQPSDEDLARVYPGAGGLVSPGGATLACTVTEDGGLADCKVESEDPPDLGFAAAALQLSGKFKLKTPTEDGRSLAGRTVVIPIQFPGR